MELLKMSFDQRKHHNLEIKKRKIKQTKDQRAVLDGIKIYILF